MYIKTLYIQNFKCFGDYLTPIEFNLPTGELGSGLNIFVGENNAGKSTVFEAINFLRNGFDGDVQQYKNKHTGLQSDTVISADFEGNVKQIIENFSDKKLGDFIENTSLSKSLLKTQRSSKVYTIKQGKVQKETNIDPKKILFWNKETKQYENPSGIDADFKKFFELDFIWADTNPEDITKFGSTTICGKLLSEIVKNFKKEKEFEEFSKAHQTAFNDETSGLKKKLLAIEKRTGEVFRKQFKEAEIQFHFEEMDVDSFFKNTKIKIKDSGVETYLDENGTGMQRSVALALLQVYAENLKKQKDSEIDKPFYLFIDEPEICLHPQAQSKLFDAIMEISKKQQVFITTHSPYFIEPDLLKNIFHFQKEKDKIQINKIDSTSKFAIRNERNFFFRHRTLLFTSKAIFLEGIDDYERYSKFCDQIKLPYLLNDFYILNGCDLVFLFEDFCNQFGIEFCAVVDSDFAYKRSYWKNNHREEVIKKLEKYALEKGFHFDVASFRQCVENEQNDEVKGGLYAVEELVIEKTIIQKVKDKNIYVLKNGEVKDYCDNEGNAVSEEKKNELTAIFQHINARLNNQHSQEIVEKLEVEKSQI